MRAQQRGGLAQARRERVAFLAMLRRSSRYNRRAAVLRAGAVLAVVALAAFSGQRGLALLMCVPAALTACLALAEDRYDQSATTPPLALLAAYQRNQRRSSGQHVLAVGTYFEILGGLMLVAIPSWVADDLPAAARVAMLAAAVSHYASSSLAIFVDHTWFNPEERQPPRWHEVVRLFAGPVTAGLVSAVALPAPWPPDAWLAAVVVCLTPLLMAFRVLDTDLTVAHLAPLVEQESEAGRELVLREAHGALSTHLRLLEQEARRQRRTAPVLYELAVSANSRLRETLTLAHSGQQSPASLAAPVLTLARAVGAAADVQITVTELSAADRDLTRLVLSDLVGNAINAGAGSLAVVVADEAAEVVVRVLDDAPAMPAGVWKTPGTSSACLEARLRGLHGSLSCEESGVTKTVTARWTRTQSLGGAGDGEHDRSGADG